MTWDQTASVMILIAGLTLWDVATILEATKHVVWKHAVCIAGVVCFSWFVMRVQP